LGESTLGKGRIERESDVSTIEKANNQEEGSNKQSKDLPTSEGFRQKVRNGPYW